jgi:putative flippase GtrA
VANVFGFLCGNIVSYTLSTRWVFEYRRLRKPLCEFGVYFAIGLIGLAWSALFLRLLVGAAHVHRDLANIISIGIVFAWHFGARKVALFSEINGALVPLRRNRISGTKS